MLPADGWYLPTSQSLHDAAYASANCPASQAVQLAAFSVAEYLPTSHASHNPESSPPYMPTCLNVPAGHAGVGDAVGDAVGFAVGDAVGASVGSAVGSAVGLALGAAVGNAVGFAGHLFMPPCWLRSPQKTRVFGRWTFLTNQSNAILVCYHALRFAAPAHALARRAYPLAFALGVGLTLLYYGLDHFVAAKRAAPIM